jgi:DNA-binding response OmpR family regulator
MSTASTKRNIRNKPKTKKPNEMGKNDMNTNEIKNEKSTGSTINVLLIEDDERLAKLTSSYLQMRGLSTSLATDGPSGAKEAVENSFDVVLLDLMLPGKDGLDVCKEIRMQSDVPIIILTALGDEGDRVMGLEVGADDYISKPFSSPELLARIRAVVRRYRGTLGPTKRSLVIGRLVLDPGAMKAILDGKELDFTAYEFAILHALAEHSGRALSREHLLDLAKGSAEASFDRSIDGHISRLRKKLGDNPRRPALLKTIRGVGYMLAIEDKI